MLAEKTYNWDDLEIGCVEGFDSNQSGLFFTRKHIKHENCPKNASLTNEMAELTLNELFTSAVDTEEMENKENNGPVANHTETVVNDLLLPIAKDNIKREILTSPKPPPSNSTPHTQNLSANKNLKVESNSQTNIKSPLALSPSNSTSNTQNLSAKKHLKVESNSQTNIKSPLSPSPSNSKRRPANLLTKFKTPPPSSASSLNSKASTKIEPPHAYDFKDIYKKKKEEMMKNLLEEERKNRIFHSRPVPKSIVKPRIQKPKLRECHLTCPKTPLVLRHSKEAEEKRRQRLEEYKRQTEPKKFSSRKPLVLNEEPFKPKKSPQVVTSQPFCLSLERRLEERKQYDEHNRIVAEERQKQEEEERKKREEEMVKQLRKQASFKARPNPFK